MEPGGSSHAGRLAGSSCAVKVAVLSAVIRKRVGRREVTTRHVNNSTASFDSAQGRPFDCTQGRPLDCAQGRPFDSAQGRP